MIGAALSFFINDRCGRLLSYRIYILVWTVGQLIAIFAENLASLYAARIITGIGMGGLLVLCPIAIVEIAPAEIRGILTSWYVVVLGLAHGVSTFCVYGVYTNPNLQNQKLQFQIVWLAPIVFLGLCVGASFFLSESPRWQFMTDRHHEGVLTLVKLRGLPATHPRVQHELQDIQDYLAKERESYGSAANASSLKNILKETFTVPANLRRVQQCLILYSLPQLSGASAISSYFVPVLKIIGIEGGESHKIFLTGMYTMSKFFFALIASFLFIDFLGRRRSLFIGITCQMFANIYVGTYVKVSQTHPVSLDASRTALAAVFLQAFGYSVGLLTLPYVFAGELWPNRLRSFGAAFSQTFHRAFIYAMTFALPSLLKETHNWGAFIFFASCCLLSLVYVVLIVPEISGMSVEEIEKMFVGAWFIGLKQQSSKSKRKLSDQQS